jgi:hypothetical protein
MGDLVFGDEKEMSKAIKYLIKEVIVYDSERIEVKFSFADLYERLLQIVSQEYKET